MTRHPPCACSASSSTPPRKRRRSTRGRTDVGALVTFTGICRGAEAGEPIAALTLEHYPGMAEAEIARHVEEASARWPLLGVTVIHRYGRIVPGENIVLVVTASSHREAAFAAAEFLMDYLKTRAPFWKQVEKADGDNLGRGQGDRRCRGRALGSAGRARGGGISRLRRARAAHERATWFRSWSRRWRSSRSASARRRPAQVSYFDVTRGAHPHDVAPAPDGTVWYTGASARARSACSIRRPARRRRFRSGRARRRTASSSGPTAPPGSPTAGRTPSRASIRRPRR